VNEVFDQVEESVKEATDKTQQFINQINRASFDQPITVPAVENLTVCMHDLNNALQLYNEKN
jgi:hypothetical protein